MYGQRKLMSLRTPVAPNVNESFDASTRSLPSSPESSRRQHRDRSVSFDYDTPSATDGETATDTEVLTETETETDNETDTRPKIPVPSTPRPGGSPRLAGNRPLTGPRHRERRQPSSQHDILARFFRKDPIGLRNLDFMRYAP